MIEFAADEITENLSAVRACKKCGELAAQHFKKCPLCGAETEIKKVHRTYYDMPWKIKGLQLFEISPKLLQKYGLEKKLADKINLDDLEKICQYTRLYLEKYWKQYLKILIPNIKKKFTKK